MIKLEKFKGNPILRPEFDWEKGGVFNPASVKSENRIYLIYRAVSSKNGSCLGIAESEDGVHFKKNPEPFLNEIEPIEDPRITRIEKEDRYVISFTDLTSGGPELGFLTLQNLKRIRGLITLDTHLEDKDASVFPRKVKGKYLLLHRPHRWSKEWTGLRDSQEIIRKLKLEIPKKLPEKPSIWISFSKDKNFSRWNSHKILMEPKFEWEERKIGIGPAPISTHYGWFLIYHGVDKNFTYRAGACLLRRNHPWEVKFRLSYPILDPTEPFEGRIVFPTGLTSYRGKLFIYYGADDKYIGLAQVNLETLLEELIKYPVK